MALNSNFRTLTADNIEGLVDNRNYLKSSFENGTIQGWTEMAVTLTSGLPTGTPTISSTAAASIALSATSTTPLSGSRSLLVTGAAGWTAGQGFISDEFTLDRMDLGKPLTVTFDYERVTGTLNFSGALGSQTLMVYIYDATAGGANWIQPAGFLGMNQSSGPGRVTATFQSSVVAGQKYRVAVIASQAVGSACSLEFDNFTCSRVTAPIGPVVTDWVSYTPTGSWANTTYAGIWRRVGDTMQGRVRLQCSAIPTNTTLTVNLPSGYSIDLAKYPSSQPATVGFAYVEDYALTGYDAFTFVFNATSIAIKVQDVNASYERGATITGNTIPFAWNNQDYIVLDFSVIIAGWSSSLQLSSDTDTRVVAMRATVSGSQAISLTAGNAVLLSYGSVSSDTHSGWSTGTNVYTIPVSGFYRLSAMMYLNAVSQGTGNYNELTVGFGSGGGFRLARNLQYLVNGDISLNGSTIRYFNAGDTVGFYYAPGANMTGTKVNDQGLNYIAIERLSGPSVIAASETVAMRAVKNGGAQTSNGNLQNIASFNSIVQDTHGIFNLSTGVATVPISGTYLCTFQVSFVANSTGARVARLLRNGNMEAEGNIYLSWSDRPVMIGTALLKCNAGDTLNLQAYQTSGGNLNYDTTLNNSTNFNIVRVGN